MMALLKKKQFLSGLVFILLLVGSTMALASPSQGMRVLPDAYKHTVIDNDAASEQESLSGKGWYYSVGGVVDTPGGLVACYRRSDFHTAVHTDIMIAFSQDAGKTWTGHHSIAHADVWNELGVWVAPQISRLSDGRLVVICDFGKRTSAQDFPMLAHWQKSDRGMMNFLLWSEDDGKTWSRPVQIDEVGGEPGYITETDSGTLLFTRTESRQSDVLWNPPLPWNDIYYFSRAVLSTDKGKTWDTTAILADDPHHGDCEVGTVNLGNGELMALTRIGFGGGAYRNPSRLVFSHDDGRTWSGHRLSPFYAQRPVLRKLASGKLLVHYRNRWGTPAIYAALIDPGEELSYEPAIWIYDESRCSLKDGILTLKTGDGAKDLVAYGFYPAHGPGSRVSVEGDFKLEASSANSFNISAGCWVRMETGRICLADKPEAGFAIDATKWHHYQFIREGTLIKIVVDGKLRLCEEIVGLMVRDVVVGCRMVKDFNWTHIGDEDDTGWDTKGVSHMKSLKVTVENPDDYDITWEWDPEQGYPDSFRRERILALDIIASSPSHTGYGGSAQMEDGTIVIVDYTVGGNGETPKPMPFIRSYVLTEDLFEMPR